ncbi:MAG: hypothetical protein ACRDT5_22860 [Mycobacterium sp.]
MSKGLGSRQRDVLAQLAGKSDWTLLGDLASAKDRDPSRYESTRRAVAKLADAGMVETRMMKPLRPTWRWSEDKQRIARDYSRLVRERGRTQLHVRLL